MEQYELYHHGVKGMKWGVRKKQYATSDIRKRYDSAKAEYKTAKKTYNKAFDQAYKYSNAHPVSQFSNKKKATEADRRWDDAISKADAANKAQAKYKKAKMERKKAIKDTHEQVNKNSTFKDKMLYSEATRKKAAKYIVDNNMSMSDAIKKANNEAIRNTALILGAYGAVTVGSAVASSMAGRQPAYSVLNDAGKVIKNFY